MRGGEAVALLSGGEHSARSSKQHPIKEPIQRTATTIRGRRGSSFNNYIYEAKKRIGKNGRRNGSGPPGVVEPIEAMTREGKPAGCYINICQFQIHKNSLTHH